MAEHLTCGLNFLHEHRIAHLDIKPDNLVYREDFTLQIIDFDVAVLLPTLDTKIDNPHGTDGFRAPEIGQNDTRRTYNPFKADRYSCGRVLQMFAQKLVGDDKGLGLFAAKLTSEDPERRPGLLEWTKAEKKKKRKSVAAAAVVRQDELQNSHPASTPNKRRRLRNDSAFIVVH